MMKMRATQGVSYPRSGHAAVFHILKYYFGDAFIYCDANNTDFCGCESVPCVNPNRTFAKNHDFGLAKGRNLKTYRDPRKFWGLSKYWNPPSPLGTPIIPTERYFIQYRNPVRSISSNFKLFLMQNPQKNKRANWEKFAFLSMIHWNRFVDKWVLDFPSNANPLLYCTYESLIADPQKRIREILTFLSDGPLDENRVKETLLEYPVADRNSISKFKYYDPKFFKKLEKFACGRVAALGLPSFDEGY